MKEKIIGIDLGTSNSCSAIVVDGEPVIIPSPDASISNQGKTYPSIVSFSEDGQILVGELAKRVADTNPKSIVKFIKRRMGEKIKISMNKKEYSPEEISAFILKKIFSDAKEYLKEEITKAVITVPAYFNDVQRQATKLAGEIAGLDVVRILNEPTAAALAYGLSKIKENKKILVFDLGGGTLDITIMEGSEGVFDVLSTSGDTKLGGSDMDNKLKEYILNDISEKLNLDLSSEISAIIRIKEAVEKAKIELSSVTESTISLPFLAMDKIKNVPINYSTTINVSLLNKLIQPILVRLKEPIDDALKSANLVEKDISEVILVGGPTKMSSVQKVLIERFGSDKINKKTDPMTCVATGAAIQGAILSGEISGIVLVDVNPISLGVQIEGGLFEVIISKNEKIPASKSKRFTTADISQQAVDIEIYQGERKFVKDNKQLGMFTLTNLKKAKNYMDKPNIDITFSVDVNGILNVHAKDADTKEEREITVKAPSKFTPEEIQKMQEEAKKFEEEDEKRKKKIVFKNNIDDFENRISLILETNKNLKPENIEKIKKIKEDVSNLKNEMETKEISILEKELESKILELGKYISENKVDDVKQEETIKDDSSEEESKTSSNSTKEEEIISAADIN